MKQLGYLLNLGIVGYDDAWDAQRSLAAAVFQGAIPDTIVLLEHPPTVTLGRRTGSEELHLPSGVEAEIVETDRGGKSTYHAPGQLVCYPILDLNRHGRDVKKYCRDLEEAVISTLAAFGLMGVRIEGLTGVWMEEPQRKIASIGVHVARWVTWHGFALNVCTDPRAFDPIVPCGLPGVRMTSMAAELGRDIAVADVEPAVIAAFGEAFGAIMHPWSPEEAAQFGPPPAVASLPA